MRHFLYVLIFCLIGISCARKSRMDETPTLGFSEISAVKLDLSDTSLESPTLILRFNYGVRIENKKTPKTIIKKIEFVDKGPKNVNYVNETIPEVSSTVNFLDGEKGTIVIAYDKSLLKSKLKAIGDSVVWTAVLTDYADRKSLGSLIPTITRVK
jgi:hypothetical protein